MARATGDGEPDGFWIKVHERMPEHPKIAGLSDRAFRLLIETWCWSRRNKTDGHVKAAVWAKRGTPAARRELVTAGLVDPAAGGVEMHNWTFRQTPDAELTSGSADLSAKRAEAGAKGGRATAANRAASAAAIGAANGQQTTEASQQLVQQTDSKSAARTRTRTPVVSSGVKPQTARTHVQASARDSDPTPSPSTPGRQRAADLNATARRPDTQRILSQFETARGTQLLSDVRRTYVRIVDQLLDEGVPEHEIIGALPDLATRGAGPAVLPHLIEERRAKQASRPVHERRPDEVADADLTPAVLDDLLGPDSWMGDPPPDAIELGPAEPRRAWYAARRDERLTERRTEARAVLARRQVPA